MEHQIQRFNPEFRLRPSRFLPTSKMQPSASRIGSQENPAMVEISRLEAEIPEDIERQSPTIAERDEINAEIKHLEEEISRLVEKYSKKSTVNYILLSTCVASDGGILASVWSGQKLELLGCTSATSTLVLSSLVSIAFTCAFVYAFLLQFKLVKHVKQLEQDRDFAIDSFLPTATSGDKRRFCPAYSKKEFENTSGQWWLPRAFFLVILMAISVCLLLSCIRVLC